VKFPPMSCKRAKHSMDRRTQRGTGPISLKPESEPLPLSLKADTVLSYCLAEHFYLISRDFETDDHDSSTRKGNRTVAHYHLHGAQFVSFGAKHTGKDKESSAGGSKEVRLHSEPIRPLAIQQP